MTAVPIDRVSPGARTDVPEMIALREAGWTLEAIGVLKGLTRERVRQHLAKAGVARRRERSPRASLDVTRIVAALRAPGVERYAEAARRTGVHPIDVSRVVAALGLAQALQRLYRLRRRARYVRAMRLLAESLGRTPRICDLNHPGSTTPSHTAYIHHFGSVRAAQAAAGLEPNPRWRHS